MTPAEEIQRGEEAAHLLDDRLFKEAYDSIDARLCEQLGMADITPERVTRLQALLAAHRTVRRYLVQVVTTGRMAAMDEETRRRRSLRDIFKVA
jgi:hypothetical protein